jgi:hypothetical protein
VKNFRELIESSNEISDRIKLLVLNSFLYKQFLNESFIESNNLIKGKNGLESKYKIEFNKIMKSKSIIELQDFQSKYLDNLSKLNQNFKKIKWKDLNDVEFIIELDKFLRLVYNSLNGKITEVNNFIALEDYEIFLKIMNIQTLEMMSKDFVEFRSLIVSILSEKVQEEYVSILGNDVKRIQKSKERKLPKITLNIKSLEESGVDIEVKD